MAIDTSNLTEEEQFRVDLLTKIAEAGLTPSEFTGAVNEMTKAAGIGGPLGTLGSGLTIAALLGIPTMAGLGTGYIHSKMDDVSPEDVNIAKRKQYLEALKTETKAIEDRLKRREWKGTPPYDP